MRWRQSLKMNQEMMETRQKMAWQRLDTGARLAFRLAHRGGSPVEASLLPQASREALAEVVEAFSAAWPGKRAWEAGQ